MRHSPEPAPVLVGGFRATLVTKLVARLGGRRDSFASLDDRLATALYLTPARPNFDQFPGIRRYFTRFVSGHKTSPSEKI
jgi:hypothetical protein